MAFALYEAGSKDETFIRVAVRSTFDGIENTEAFRRKKRINRGIGPIDEQRIVPAESIENFPLHAPLDEVMEMVRENNEMYPE